MISTVTMTMTMVAAASIGALTATLLISLLATKEIISADTKLKVLGNSLNIGILPLLISFAFAVAYKAIMVLS